MKEQNLFGAEELEPIAVIRAMKDDLNEMETDLQSQRENLQEANTIIQEIKESIQQPDFFADLSEDFGQLEDLIGSEAAFKLVEAFAGSTIYIPKSILTYRNYYGIKKDYKAGANYRELSVKYGYTETHIRNIVHRKK